MNRRMMTPSLLQAISRLEQAVARAETAMKAAGEANTARHEAREVLVRQAVSELDGLISTLQEGANG